MSDLDGFANTAGRGADSGDVWVAEGGPFDFTARVIRRIQGQFNSLEAAFDYLDPNERLDFSDPVELLHIIDETG